MSAFTGLPSSWELIAFDDAVDVVSDRGIRIKQKDYLDAGDIPVIDQGEEFIGGFTNNIEAKIFSKSPVILFGDHTRRFKFVKFPFAVGADGVKLFSPNLEWNPTLLFLQLENIDLDNRGYGRHYQYLRKECLALPPANEQTRIVEKLEEVLSDLDAGVAELRAAQAKLVRYRQSLLKAAVEGALTAEWRQHNTPEETGAQLLQRILTERRARWEAKQLAKFAEQGKAPPKDCQKRYPEPVQPDTADLPELPEGWVWASVEQIASDERYSLSIGPFGSNLKVSDYRDTGVPLVFVRNIRSGNYGGAYTKYVTPEKAKQLVAHSASAGDVLITKMGEPPGDADVYPDNQPLAIITADCIKVRCWNGLMRPDFLKSVINSHIGQQQIEPMTQGVAQKKVSLGRFTSLAIPIPSMEEQQQIMAMVSEANAESAAQETATVLSLKQSTAQRKNILRAAFSGQLVPQDPNDEHASALLARIRAQREAGDPSATRKRGRKAKGTA